MKTPGGKERKVARLQKKEDRLVYKGNKAVDEGREKKADRILGRAAKVENRKIKTAEKMKKGGSTKTTKK
jgi:phage shock protein A